MTITSNYPPRADNSSAPWNQREPELEECPDCMGQGGEYWIDEEANPQMEKCYKCEGTGTIVIEL